MKAFAERPKGDAWGRRCVTTRHPCVTVKPVCPLVRSYRACDGRRRVGFLLSRGGQDPFWVCFAICLRIRNGNVRSHLRSAHSR